MAEQGFSRPLICIDERNQAYKSLIQDIAERLGEKDVNSIVYQRSLPEPARPQTGLDLLSQLDRAGLFSPSNIDPLTDLLKKIHRYDLVSQFIDGYLQRYGTGNPSSQEISPERHSSLPSQRSPRMVPINERHLSLPTSAKTGMNLSALQETVDQIDTSPSHCITEGCASGEQGEMAPSLEQMPKPLPNVQGAPPVPYGPMQPSSTHFGLKRQPHSYSLMDPGHDHVYGYDQGDLLPTEGAELYLNHTPRTRHLSDQLSMHCQVPRTSTPQYPNEDRPRKASLQYQLPVNLQGSFGRAMSSGGATPASISGASSLQDRLDSHSASLSSYSSSEFVHSYGQYDLSRQTSLPTQQYYQQYSRMRHSLDNSHRYKPTFLHHSGPLPPTNPTQVLTVEERPQMQLYLDDQLGAPIQTPYAEAAVPLPPVQLTHSQTQPVMRLRARPQLPNRSMTPPPKHPNTAQGQSQELYTTRSEARIPQAFAAHPHATVETTRHPLSFQRFDSPYTTISQQSATSGTGEPIEPWMSVSNEHLPHHTIQTHPSTEVVAQHLEETSLSPSPSKEIEECVSPSASSVRKSYSFTTRSRPNQWRKLALTRKQSRDSVLRWQIKRNLLNKAIYKHKENKCYTCSEKLELDAGHGGKANPRLIFKLYPYGLDRDRKTNVTLHVEIDVPRKCPRLADSTKLRLSVVAYDLNESRKLSEEQVVEKQANLRDFLLHSFITHDSLKNSHSNHIEVQASAELLIEQV